MKLRELKKLLNINYNVCLDEDDINILIGTDYIPDILVINTETKEIKKQYNSSLSEELKFKIDGIFNQLNTIVNNEEYDYLWNSDDEIENPITLYYEKNGVIEETTTDKIGYPNLTKEGYMQYNNTFFESKEECYKATEKHYLTNLDSKIYDFEEKLEKLMINYNRIKDMFQTYKEFKDNKKNES